MTEQQLKEKLENLGLDVAPECLAMLTAKKTQNPEHRCQLSMAYQIRSRSQQVERDYQENSKIREQLQTNLMDAFMSDHQSVTRLVAGLRAKLQTSDSAPFGRYTGRFPDVADIALYLIFDAPRSERPWLKWWQFWK